MSAEEKLKIATKALEFYSNDNDWGLWWEGVNRPNVNQDHGKHAREALEEIGHSTD